MTKAEEFEQVAGVNGTESITKRANDLAIWIWKNRDLIARALKTQEAFDRGEPNDDHAGFYSYERDYAARMLVKPESSNTGSFVRGFFEGWNAARRFVIQDP